MLQANQNQKSESSGIQKYQETLQYVILIFAFC